MDIQLDVESVMSKVAARVNQDQAPSQRRTNFKKAITLGGAAVATGGLLYSAFRRRPGAIQKAFGKDLNPTLLTYGKRTKQNTFEQISGKMFNQRRVGDMPRAKDIKKGEIGLSHGFDYKDVTKGVHKKPMITAPGDKQISNAEDKLVYGKKLYNEGTGARTFALSKSQVKHVKGLKTDDEAVKYIEKNFGKDKVIFKPRSDSGADGLPTTIGKNSLVTGKVNKMVKHFRKRPERFIGQDKLNIEKEFRVRVVNGEYVGALNRYPNKKVQNALHGMGILQGEKQGIGMIPLSKHFGEGRGLRKFVEANPNTFKITNKKGVNTFAFDVARVKGRGGKSEYKVIEANTTSGADLDNPIIAGGVYKKLTGRASKLEKQVKGGAAAVTATAGVGGAYAIDRHDKKKRLNVPKLIKQSGYEELYNEAFQDELNNILGG